VSGKQLARKDVAAARDLLLKKQGYKCLLCGCDFREQTVKNRKRVSKYKPALDHCHNHGYVRGVLCVNCNGREGEIFNRANRCKRDGTVTAWLQGLVDYWLKHEEPQTIYIHPDHKSEDDKRLARNAKERKKRAQAKAVALLKGK
jgi:hypothetical protein